MRGWGVGARRTVVRDVDGSEDDVRDDRGGPLTMLMALMGSMPVLTGQSRLQPVHNCAGRSP